MAYASTLHYVTDTNDDVVHLLGDNATASHTLCGLRRIVGRFTFGDETITGIAATCQRCIDRRGASELAPSFKVVTAAQALLAAGLGEPNGAGSTDRRVFSVLDVNHAGIVHDPEALFLTREAAMRRNDEVRALKDTDYTNTAFVGHRTDGTYTIIAD